MELVGARKLTLTLVMIPAITDIRVLATWVYAGKGHPLPTSNPIVLKLIQPFLDEHDSTLFMLLFAKGVLWKNGGKLDEAVDSMHTKLEESMQRVDALNPIVLQLIIKAGFALARPLHERDHDLIFQYQSEYVALKAAARKIRKQNLKMANDLANNNVSKETLREVSSMSIPELLVRSGGTMIDYQDDTHWSCVL